MRILVAIDALGERNPGVARLVVGPWRVTLCARYLSMKTGQRVASFRMIELADRDRVPIRKIVTLRAIRSQLSLVLVLMASHTGWGNSKKRAVQVFDFDIGPLRRRDFVRRVAAIAGKSSVFALEQVAGQLVIEGLGVPFNQGEIFAVVVGVTTGAVLARARLDVIARV